LPVLTLLWFILQQRLCYRSAWATKAGCQFFNLFESSLAVLMVGACVQTRAYLAIMQRMIFIFFWIGAGRYLLAVDF
jgi:hypothetical protein